MSKIWFNHRLYYVCETPFLVPPTELSDLTYVNAGGSYSYIYVDRSYTFGERIFAAPKNTMFIHANCNNDQGVISHYSVAGTNLPAGCLWGYRVYIHRGKSGVAGIKEDNSERSRLRDETASDPKVKLEE